MKKINKHTITNIENTDLFDNTFSLDYMTSPLAPLIQGEGNKSVQIIYLRDLLEEYRNEEMLEKTHQKPAMWSNVYSPKDELEIFTKLFDEAIEKQEKIHIVWVTLKQEIEILEAYYLELWFMREDINCFEVDFSVPLVTVSCHIENLIWRGSDYKAQRDKIFFNPPVRESGQNKALFKWITRGVIAGIELWEFTDDKEDFIGKCIREEKILPLHMGKVLKYNLEDIGLEGEERELQIQY